MAVPRLLILLMLVVAEMLIHLPSEPLKLKQRESLMDLVVGSYW